MEKNHTFRKVFVIIGIFLIIVTIFTTVDRVRFNHGDNPTFTINVWGGNCKIYMGVVYSVTYFYPEINIYDENTEYPPEWKWIWEDVRDIIYLRIKNNN